MLSKLYAKNTKYTKLFVSLIVIFILSPLTQYFTFVNVIFSFSFFFAIILAINTLSFPSQIIFICRMIAIIALIPDLLSVIGGDQDILYSEFLLVISNFCFGLFILISMVAITTRIVEEETINQDVIRGAICLYLMLGILWFFFYKVVFFFDENAFSFPNTEFAQITSQLFYFSFTTLTTLGYGDITPANPFAMMLSNGEALIGQIFPAIFLARLVSLYERD
jgi:hypothetical protein